MNPLQTQYPLSPRKFWKKFIGKLTLWIFVWLGISAFILILITGSTTPTALSFLFLIFVIETLLIVTGLSLYAWYIRVYIRRYYYDTSENFVTIKKGVFAPAEIHVMYSKIQDVYVDQDILDRIMGLYDVHLASATITSGIEAHIDGVDSHSAEALKQILLDKMQDGSTTPPHTENVQAQTLASMPVPEVQAALSEEISSKQFSISSKWTTMSIFFAFFTSVSIGAFLSFLFIVDSSTNGTSAQTTATTLIMPLILTWIVLSVLLFILNIFYILIWKKVYYFDFLANYIYLKTGVIARKETHLPYRSVQDVNVTQGIVERMFGLATVTIENAAKISAPRARGIFAAAYQTRINFSGIRIPGQSLANANHIAEVVRNITMQVGASHTGL